MVGAGRVNSVRGRIRVALVLAPTFFVSALGSGLIHPVAVRAATTTTYQLLWGDDFNGKKGSLPNPKVWIPEVGGNMPNGELEYYTKSPTNVSLDGKGHLVITAQRIADQSMTAVKRDPAIERMLNSCNACQFTSAKLKTAGRLSFLYGRLEIRMKTAAGLGTWPAFWMLGNDLNAGIPWPDAGEIDIMETRGSTPSVVYGTLHGPGMVDSGAGYGSVYDNQKSLSSGYHVYAIEWKKNQIDFYLDDNLYFTASSKDSSAGNWVYNQPFFMILNLAMGGQFTGDIDPAINQAQISIDYVHYYSVNGVGKVLKK